jgi:CBS domain-containing protein
MADTIGYQIGRLPSAHTAPLSVSPDDTVEKAVTIMLARDFSQLPVMTSDRHVKGVISWKSIGKRTILGHEHRHVRECMDQHYEVSTDTSVFNAMGLILKYEFVLVRNKEHKICGIVTTTDLGNQFRELSEPYLLLREVENHLRALVSPRFTAEELSACHDPGDPTHRIETAADLTFGDYVRLLSDPSNWERLEVHIDRAAFVDTLDRIRMIRNDVMHFDPDPLNHTKLGALRAFAQFLSEFVVSGNASHS